MKEFKFKDVAGFEEGNLPRQLDDFEAKGAKALKTRYIYDFSAPAGQSIIPLDDNPNYHDKRLFMNLITEGDNWDYYTGSPGHAELMVKGIKYYTDANPHNPNQHIFNTIPDISGERHVPYWDENTMLYLDTMDKNVYGGSGLRNFIKSFRTGYIEFTFKTNKANCVLGVGSVKKTDYGYTVGPVQVGPLPENTSSRQNPATTVVIDSDNSYLTDDLTNTDTMYLNLKDGKLELFYENEFGNTKKEFTILGLTNLADDVWHHVVINFNKPGIVEDHGKKINKKFIEFWVDGQLEKRYDDYINNNQVFFPLIEWLMMDPFLATSQSDLEGWESYDTSDRGETPSRKFVGNRELSNQIRNRSFNDLATATAFRGSFNHYLAGFNFPLSKFEIQQRYRLFNYFEKPAVDLFVASASIVEPEIFVNKKRALKLFWNNLVSDNAKDGIELDNNYIVDSYSVTHKTLNSKTEINNLNLAPSETLTFLKDVRAVFKDYVNIFGPGKQNLYNRSEIWDSAVGEQYQLNMSNFPFDGLNSVGLDMDATIKSRLSSYSVKNMPFSGLDLQNGDRILLTNQFNKKDNGIYIFNGYDKLLTRAEDAFSPKQLKNAVVRVIDGYYKDTSWILSNQISSLADNQEWIELEYHPSNENINSQPIFLSRWSNEKGIERFIDLEQDIDISKYDLIVFMNYPDSNQQINDHAVNLQSHEVKIKYDNFIKSLQNVCAQGASLYVSSPKLAQDLKIIESYELIDQMLETSDAQSAAISPFEINEPATQYFDTHRINQYQLQTEVPGLTDKETYILTDFINYTPENINEQSQYHAKYAYRQFGLQEGNQFFIPSLSLLNVSENEKLPGFSANRKTSKELAVVEPHHVNAGTIVTKLQNTYYQGNQLINNPHDDDATTIIVHDGQLLDGQPIAGKIFVNFVEDGYTMSREEYNKAVIQVLPQNDINETVATRAWQYSTTRLNRIPKRVNIKELTEFGQTTPTNGGGGPLIQAPTNSSNGIIRSEVDRGNINYQSDLYTNESEEIYPLQEIPVLSMTWLGLSWLAG